MKHLILCCLIALGASGVIAQPIYDSLTFEGDARPYRLHLPNNTPPSTPVPVVFAFHGFGDNMDNFGNAVRFHTVGDTANFITVYPQGTEMGIQGIFTTSAWRVGTSFDNGISDSPLLGVILDTLAQQYNIDLNRVYATGFSLGGFMTNLVACEQPDRLAAIASHSGTIADVKMNDCMSCNSAKTTPSLHIHGTIDSTIYYDGGTFDLIIAQFPFQGAEFLVNNWATVDSCGTVPDSTRIMGNGGLTFDKFEYTGCLDQTEVVHLRANGLGHTWLQRANGYDATYEIWKFLSKHSLANRDTTRCDTATGISFVKTETESFDIYPNPTTGAFTVASTYTAAASITVYNALGQKVYAIEASDNKQVIDLAESKSGIYFIRLTDSKSGKLLSTKKLLLQ